MKFKIGDKISVKKSVLINDRYISPYHFKRLSGVILNAFNGCPSYYIDFGKKYSFSNMSFAEWEIEPFHEEISGHPLTKIFK